MPFHFGEVRVYEKGAVRTLSCYNFMVILMVIRVIILIVFLIVLLIVLLTLSSSFAGIPSLIPIKFKTRRRPDRHKRPQVHEKNHSIFRSFSALKLSRIVVDRDPRFVLVIIDMPYILPIDITKEWKAIHMIFD